MLQITDTIMNNYTLFYSTNVFNSSIEIPTVNFQIKGHCMNNIVKIRLNNFEFPMNKIQILHTHYDIKL